MRVATYRLACNLIYIVDAAAGKMIDMVSPCKSCSRNVQPQRWPLCKVPRTTTAVGLQEQGRKWLELRIPSNRLAVAAQDNSYNWAASKAANTCSYLSSYIPQLSMDCVASDRKATTCYCCMLMCSIQRKRRFNAGHATLAYFFLF